VLPALLVFGQIPKSDALGQNRANQLASPWGLFSRHFWFPHPIDA
jgi:hypothetical protein